MNIKLALYIVVGVAALAGSFVAGGLYVGSIWGMTNPFGLGIQAKFGSASGILVDRTAGSITLAGLDGTTKTVMLNEHTTIEKGERITINELVPGVFVNTSGPLDEQGNVLAAIVRTSPAPGSFATTTPATVPQQ